PPAPASQLEALEQAAARAQRQGGLGERLAKLDETQEHVAAMAATRLQALGLWSGALEQLAALPVPLEETVARAERAWEELSRRAAALEERRRALAGREEELARERVSLERGGAVPSEEELAAARAARDEAWRLVRRALDGADVASAARALDPERPLAELYAERSRRADEAADRLRREAERVARRERLVEAQAQAEAERAALARERAELDG